MTSSSVGPSGYSSDVALATYHSVWPGRTTNTPLPSSLTPQLSWSPGHLTIHHHPHHPSSLSPHLPASHSQTMFSLISLSHFFTPLPASHPHPSPPRPHTPHPSQPHLPAPTLLPASYPHLPGLTPITPSPPRPHTPHNLTSPPPHPPSLTRSRPHLPAPHPPSLTPSHLPSLTRSRPHLLAPSLRAYLALALAGVVEPRCTQDHVDLLPACLVSVLEVQPALQLGHARRGGEVLLQQNLASLFRTLQSAGLARRSMR